MNRPKLRGPNPTILVLVAAILSTAPASAATLDLSGPAGAVVTLDGEPLGVMPLQAPIEIGMGEHRITSTLTGAHTFDTVLQIIDDAQIVHLQVRFIPLSRWRAATSSLLLAGSGQRYESRPRMGAALTGIEVVGLLSALMSELQVQNSRDDYLLARDAYAGAVSSTEINRWRTAAATSHDDMLRAADRRDLGLAVAVGAVAVSVLDAWFRFPALDAGVDLKTVGPFDSTRAPAGLAPRAHVALTLNF